MESGIPYSASAIDRNLKVLRREGLVMLDGNLYRRLVAVEPKVERKEPVLHSAEADPSRVPIVAQPASLPEQLEALAKKESKPVEPKADAPWDEEVWPK